MYILKKGVTMENFKPDFNSPSTIERKVRLKRECQEVNPSDSEIEAEEISRLNFMQATYDNAYASPFGGGKGSRSRRLAWVDYWTANGGH